MGGDRASSGETGSLRLFVAVDVPDDVKRSVEAAIEPWRRGSPQVRWIRREDWHITLKFLGATDPRLLPWIEETIVAVASAHTPWEAVLGNLGAFPIPSAARVLWVGVQERADHLGALASDLDVALAREFPIETRPFHPHLTVARSRPPLVLPDGFAETRCSARAFVVDRLVLFRSDLGNDRPRYEALRRTPLGR